MYMDKDWEKIHNFLTDYEVAVDNCDRCQSAVKFLMNFGTSAATAGKKIGNHKISKGQFSKICGPIKNAFFNPKNLWDLLMMKITSRGQVHQRSNKDKVHFDGCVPNDDESRGEKLQQISHGCRSKRRWAKLQHVFGRGCVREGCITELVHATTKAVCGTRLPIGTLVASDLFASLKSPLR